MHPIGHLETPCSTGVQSSLQANGFPTFKGPELPTKSGAQGIVNAIKFVADLWHPVTHVGKDVCENATVKFTRLVLAVEQELGTLPQVVDIFRGRQRGELDFLLGLVFQGFQVERMDFLFSVGHHLFVKALT